MGIPSNLFPQNVLKQIGYPSRSIGARAARQAGKDFENLILASQRDERGQLMKLVQIKNFAKRVRWGKGQDSESRLIEERSPFDFCGVVIGTGQGIFFDAKNCGDGYASLQVNEPAIVKPHQINALEDLERGGAIAGFLVRSVRAGRYLWLPASKARRPKPIRWDDPAFVVLGQIREGYGVPLRRIVERESLFDRMQAAGVFQGTEGR